MKMEPFVILTGTFFFLFTFQMTLGQSAEQNLDYRLKQNLDDIKGIIVKVNKYAADGRRWLADELDEKWLLRAVSLKARNKWSNQEMLAAEERKIFDQVYHSLYSAIAGKVSSHKPESKCFTFRGQTEEAAMRSALSNASTLLIHKIGLADERWQQFNPSRKRD